MDRSARKQRHELARKRHRQQLQELIREQQRRGPSRTAAWVFSVLLVLFLGFVVLVWR